MAKSWVVGGRNTGEVYLASTTGYTRIGASIESDLVFDTNQRFPEAVTIRKLAVRCGANTLTGTCTCTIRLNDTTDTALSVTFASTDANVEKRDTTNSVSLAANDDITLKVVTGAGTSITLLSHSLEVEPDNSSNTLTLFGIKSPGSTSGFTPGTPAYFLPFGARSLDTTEVNGADAGAQWPSLGAFTALYFTAISGTVTIDMTVTVRTRKNAANGGQSVTFTAVDDQVAKYDTVNTDTLALGDLFDYQVDVPSGATGTFNLEGIGCWLRSTAGEFVLATGWTIGERQLDSLTKYYNLGGELDEQASASEAACQQMAPFDLTVTKMQVRSDREVMTGDSTVTLRKGGVATELAVTFNGTTTGILEDTGSVSVTGGTDSLANEIVLGAGTNRDFNFIAYLAKEVVAAGGSLLLNPPEKLGGKTGGGLRGGKQ